MPEVILLGALVLDGRLSRTDGAILLLGFAASAAWLLHLARHGLDIESGEVAETLTHDERRGRPDISYGNVAGSALTFFLFNAGLIAMIRPIQVSDDVLNSYLPACLAAVTAASLFLARGNVGRIEGTILTAAYAAFAIGGYLL